MKIIEYFKDIPCKRSLFAQKARPAVVSYLWRSLRLLGLVVFVHVNIFACSHISTGKVNRSLIKSQSLSEDKSSQSNTAANLAGSWKVGFRYQGKTGLGTMQIQQNNQNFVGSGKDENNGESFKIEHGLVKGNEVIFLKRYDNRPNQAVQYHGKFSYLPTEGGEQPYMGGDFSVELNGNLTVGEWEAAMVEVKAHHTAAKNSKKPTNSPVNNSVNNSPVAVSSSASEHCPDLSGKWNVAFEYNFKTAHSIMFLEQDSNKLTGHGFDLNNKEKFVIKKGWYAFPHITIVRQYLTGSEPGRTVIFKADVTQVSDKDYRGPYLSGKTQGGGAWEAERVN